MNNYEYCADYATKQLSTGGRVLDYGCGQGAIVDLLRTKGIDAVGCDVFYNGGDYTPDSSPEKVNNAIFRMDGDRIPFADESFDLIINNQVLEHVPNLDIVVSQMARVLKPGGVVLSLFPDRGVWREGHCGIPFLHWFPKGSSFRVNYAHILRIAGAGYHHGDKTPREWAIDFCQWLDDWTYYRSYAEISQTFQQHLSLPNHLEADWFRKRFGRGNWPGGLRNFLARRFAHLTFETRKSPE